MKPLKKKGRPVAVLVSPTFKNILKAEAALNGKSVAEFTDDLANDEKFISDYFMENKKNGLRRKNNFGFKW